MKKHEHFFEIAPANPFLNTGKHVVITDYISDEELNTHFNDILSIRMNYTGMEYEMRLLRLLNTIRETRLKEFAISKNCTFHHTGTDRGYVSLKTGPRIRRYSGRFGKGYKIFRHNPQSKRYVLIDYYIYNNDFDNEMET